MDYSAIIAKYWFQHAVTVTRPGKSNALGQSSPAAVHKVKAAVDAAAQVVTDAQGQEVTASAVLQWSAGAVLPAPGWTVTLPEEFGLKPDRTVITAQRVTTGTGLTPDYIEVTVK